MTGPGDLPHLEVHVRLGISAIHGIGVLAVARIEQGTALFANDRSGLVWVSKATLEALQLSDAERAFYRDFGIDAGEAIGCPANFQNLTPGWYLNQPPLGEAANVRVDADLNFFAARCIAEGEELTVSYADINAAGARYLEKHPPFPSAPPS